MNNFQWIQSMPLPVFAQWLCDINKCDTCFFKDKKEEGAPGKCTWYWLNEENKLLDDDENVSDTHSVEKEL